MDGSAIFIGADDKLVAVHSGSGTDMWSFEAESKIGTTPTVSSELVFIGTASGTMHAIDTLTGVETWSYRSGGAINSSPSLSADGKMLIFGSDALAVIALETTTGILLWQYTIGDVVFSSPLMSKDGTLVFVGSDDTNLHAIHAHSGTVAWTFATDSHVRSDPSLSADGSSVIFGSGDTNIYAVSTTDGSLQWKYTTGGQVYSSPTLGRGTFASDVFCGSQDHYLYSLTEVCSAEEATPAAEETTPVDSLATIGDICTTDSDCATGFFCASLTGFTETDEKHRLKVCRLGTHTPTSAPADLAAEHVGITVAPTSTPIDDSAPEARPDTEDGLIKTCASDGDCEDSETCFAWQGSDDSSLDGIKICIAKQPQPFTATTAPTVAVTVAAVASSTVAAVASSTGLHDCLDEMEKLCAADQNQPTDCAVCIHTNKDQLMQVAGCQGTHGSDLVVAFCSSGSAEIAAVVATVEATGSPTIAPTVEATGSPTIAPTVEATGSPTIAPTVEATGSPTIAPTVEATGSPTIAPTFTPSNVPSASPTDAACTDGLKNEDETDVDCGGVFCDPCEYAQSCLTGTDCTSGKCVDSACKASTSAPTIAPTKSPSATPSVLATDTPTAATTDTPTAATTDTPTAATTEAPTAVVATEAPTAEPPTVVTEAPTVALIPTVESVLPVAAGEGDVISAEMEISGETVESFDGVKQGAFKAAFATSLQVSSTNIELSIRAMESRRSLRQGAKRRLQDTPTSSGDGIVVDITLTVAHDSTTRVSEMLKDVNVMSVVATELVTAGVITSLSSFTMDYSSVQMAEAVNVALDDAAVLTEAPQPITAQVVAADPSKIHPGQKVRPAGEQSKVSIWIVGGMMGILSLGAIVVFILRFRKRGDMGLDMLDEKESKNPKGRKNNMKTPAPNLGFDPSSMNSNTKLVRTGASAGSRSGCDCDDLLGMISTVCGDLRDVDTHIGNPASGGQEDSAASGGADGEQGPVEDIANAPLLLSATELVQHCDGLNSAALKLDGDTRLFKTDFKGEPSLVKRVTAPASSAVRHLLELWRNCSHPHLLPLLGAMVQAGKPVCLVYPFMSEGSLSEHLNDPIRRFAMGWKQRLLLLNATGKAVLFLHSADESAGKPVITHGAIKTSNVLLDSTNHAKLTDISLDRSTASVSEDIFAFGVLLLEVLSGELSPCSVRGEATKQLATAKTRSKKSLSPQFDLNMTSDDRGRNSPVDSESSPEPSMNESSASFGDSMFEQSVRSVNHSIGDSMFDRSVNRSGTIGQSMFDRSVSRGSTVRESMFDRSINRSTTSNTSMFDRSVAVTEKTVYHDAMDSPALNADYEQTTVRNPEECEDQQEDDASFSSGMAAGFAAMISPTSAKNASPAPSSGGANNSPPATDESGAMDESNVSRISDNFDSDGGSPMNDSGANSSFGDLNNLSRNSSKCSMSSLSPTASLSSPALSAGQVSPAPGEGNSFASNCSFDMNHLDSPNDSGASLRSLSPVDKVVHAANEATAQAIASPVPMTNASSPTHATSPAPTASLANLTASPGQIAALTASPASSAGGSPVAVVSPALDTASAVESSPALPPASPAVSFRAMDETASPALSAASPALTASPAMSVASPALSAASPALTASPAMSPGPSPALSAASPALTASPAMSPGPSPALSAGTMDEVASPAALSPEGRDTEGAVTEAAALSPEESPKTTAEAVAESPKQEVAPSVTGRGAPVSAMSPVSARGAPPTSAFRNASGGMVSSIKQQRQNLSTSTDLNPLLVRARRESAANFADRRMQQRWPAMVAYSVHSLAIRCTAAEPSERPEFSTVLKGLELLTTAAGLPMNSKDTGKYTSGKENVHLGRDGAQGSAGMQSAVAQEELGAQTVVSPRTAIRESTIVVRI
jgi:hypothetical protein